MSTLSISDVIASNVDGHPQPNAQAPEIVREVMRLHGGDDSAGVTDQGRSAGAQSQPAASAAATPALGTLDSEGTPYDPSEHVDSGKFVTARGTWRKRRRGAVPPPDRSVELPPLAPAVEPSADVGSAIPAVQHEALADAWVDRAVTILRVALGPDWEPSTEERRDLTASTTRYMSASGWQMDLTPGWSLLLAVTMYAAPRAALPSTRERVGAIIGRVTGRRADVAAESQPAPTDKPRPAPVAPPGRYPFGEAA